MNTLDLPTLKSRCHKLNTFENLWVLRDDELSFGISGSKLRKFSSLIPYIARNYHGAAIIGGTHSNNIVGLAQACHERTLITKPFLLGPPHSWGGNAALVKLFWDEAEVHWIKRPDWNNAYRTATNWAEMQEENWTVIPEGSFMKEAIPGTLTIIESIKAAEAFHRVTFRSLYVDAGTGFTAQCLINAARRKMLPNLRKIIVVSMATKQPEFEINLAKVNQWFGELNYGKVQQNFEYQLTHPYIGRSFGAFPTEILEEIRNMAQKEGILTDPMYTAKLFHYLRKIQRNNEDSLVIHSGGAYALSGFTHKWT